MMKWDNLVFKLFIFWYGCGLILVGFDMLPPVLKWANAFFLILCGFLGGIYFLKTFSPKKGFLLSGFIFVFSMIAEGLGVHYGWIFGRYDYSGDFGIKLAGVPIGIGFAWMMVVAVTHVLSMELVKPLNNPIAKWILYVIVAASIAVLMDLIIDPVAYLVKGYWGWEGDSFYYRVPLQNFTGWFWVSLFFHSLLYPLYVRNKVPHKKSFLIWKHRMAVLFGMVMGMFNFLALLDGLWLAFFITGIPSYFLLVAYRTSTKQREMSQGEVIN